MSDLFQDHVDYLIIGAGSAGCALAGRLSEDPQRNVLLIEAGKDYAPGDEPSEILDSFAGTAFSNPRFTWPGLTAAFRPRPGNQTDMRPRRRYTQGRVIGGTSAVNGMVVNRGLPTDYSGWVAAGATGWGWDDVLPYFKKLEHDRDFDGPYHGNDGPIGVRRLFRDRWPPFVDGVMQAMEREGFIDLKDQNSTFEDGFFPLAISNIDDQRVSAARGYLTKAVRARPNLRIAGEVEALRILFDGPRSVGARVRRDGAEFDVTAGEVIVSMGAIQSPALLMRSGIGSSSALAELGIKVVSDRPGVGRHLMEHPGVNFGAYMKPSARMPAGLRRQTLSGLRYSSGLSGCPAGDMFIMPSNKAAWHAIGEQLGLIMMWVNKSYSTGEVRLSSADPASKPQVDLNMVSDRRDLDRLVLGVRLLIRLQKQSCLQDTVEQIFPISYSDLARKIEPHTTWNKWQARLGAQLMDASPLLRRFLIKNLIAEAPSIDDLANDDRACENWIRTAIIGHWHASCTCRMGAADDSHAVTDPYGRVYGVTGLRVCDASIMPVVPSANTNIPTIMIGEKIAASIKIGH